MNNGATKWLLGVLTTIALMWVLWVSATLVQASTDHSTLVRAADDIREIRDILKERRR